MRKRYRYIVYGLSPDSSQITILKLQEKDTDRIDAKKGYQDFVKENLPEDDCRYAVYDFEFEKAPGEGVRNKICFINW